MENYFNRDYKISSKVRELIENKRGKKIDLSYVQIENILSNVYQNKYTSMTHSFTDNDKERLMSTLKQYSPSSMDEKGIISLSDFLKDNFTEDEIKMYADYILKNNYHPGSMMYGVKINNDNVIKMIECLDVYELLDCLILSKKYINDIINFLNKNETDYQYDKSTLLIEKDITHLFIDKFNEIKQIHDVDYYNDDNIFIVSTNNEDAINFLKETYKELKITKTPKHLFYDRS